MKKEDESLLALKVLEEIAHVEKSLTNLGFSWVEECSGVRCDDLDELTFQHLLLMEKKYGNCYKLSDFNYGESNNYLPLKRVELIDDYYNKKHICEFENIFWYGVNSKRTKRNFEFYNDGNINFGKEWIGNLTIRRPKGVSYNGSYNVLTDDYELEYFDENYNDNNSNDITFVKRDKTLYMSLNDINIRKHLDTGKKELKVLNTRKRGRYGINSELLICLDEYDNIYQSELVTIVDKEREKGIKKYVFSVDEEGLEAYHIDDNTITNLIKNPTLLDLAFNLICGGSEVLTTEQKIISEYLNNFLKTTKKYSYKENIMPSEFNNDNNSINEVENKIIDTIKEIKGEIPLKGFIERLNNTINKNKQKIKE